MDDLLLVKETLDDAAGRVVSRPPLRTELDRSLRRVTRRRRATRAAQTVGALLSVVAVAGGVQVSGVPLPSWAPSVSVGRPASALAGLPTRGSLAADGAWLAAFRARVATFDRSESGGERWRVPSAGAVDVLFAGDVGDFRVALVETPLRWGAIEDTQQIWYLGARGSAAETMEESGNDEPSDLATATFGPADGLVAATGSVTVVVGRPGLAVEQVGPPTVDATGRVDWPSGPATPAGDGAWTATETSGRSYLRWAGAEPVPVGRGGWDQPTGGAAAALASAVLPAERTGSAPPVVVSATPGDERVASSVEAAVYAAAVPPTGLVSRVVWSGTLDGTPTDVVRVTTTSGGGVVVALGAFGEPVLRPMAAVPVARGAQPAMAWTYPGPSSAPSSAPSSVSAQDATRFDGPARVGLVGPVTAQVARVVRADGPPVKVPLVDGVGGGTVEGARSVEFLDAEGQVVARAVVQAYRPGDDAVLLPPKAG